MPLVSKTILLVERKVCNDQGSTFANKAAIVYSICLENKMKRRVPIPFKHGQVAVVFITASEVTSRTCSTLRQVWELV